MKQYHYTNDIGRHKCLTVNIDQPDERGRYTVILWCTDNGEMCGHDQLSHDEIETFLAHYGIAIDF